LFAPECALPLNFWTKFGFKVFLPLFLTSLSVLVHVVRELLLWNRSKETVSSLRSRLELKAISTVVFVMITLWTSSIATTLSAFNCVKEPDGTLTVSRDSSQSCFDGGWLANVFTISLSILIYLIVVPGALIYICWINRRTHGLTSFLAKYESLVYPYRYPYFFWELVVMLKRAMFVISIDFLRSSSYEVRFGVSIFVLFVFFWLDVIFVPFSSRELNILNIT
jgi:hypothetical protein